MTRSVLFALVLLIVSAPAFAQSMNAEKFYRTATDLQSKGAFAVFSMGKVKALTAEGRAAAMKATANRNADKAAGRPQRFCPPEGQQQMGSSEFLQRLSAIPGAQRSRIDMTEAVTRMFAGKWPCSDGRG